MRMTWLAVLIALSVPSYASDATPGVGDGKAAAASPQSTVPFKIPDNWALKAIQVRPGADGQIDYDSLLKWIDAFDKTAGKPAAKKDLPTQKELDALDISLPFTVADKKQLSQRDHIILWDNSGKGYRASWHEPQWQRQTEIVKKKLIAAGADPKRIHIYPVKKGDDFKKSLKDHAGNKQIYVLGHAGPLALHFGDDKIDVAKDAKDLKAQKVDMICHYGCSFTNVDEASLKPLQDNLPNGTRITLYGHRTPSTKKDDDPFDPKNPIVRCEVDKDCAKLYIPQKERAAMTARAAAQLIGAVDFFGISPQLPDEWKKIAAYNGQTPTKVGEPASLTTGFTKVGGTGTLKPRTQLPKALTAKKPGSVPAPPTLAKSPPKASSNDWLPSWVKSALGLELN